MTSRRIGAQIKSLTIEKHRMRHLQLPRGVGVDFWKSGAQCERRDEFFRFSRGSIRAY